MKTGPDSLGTAQNESGSAKHENGTLRPRYHRKRVGERKTLKRDTSPSVPSKTSPEVQNMKTEHDALGTAENESGSAKNENGTLRPRYRRKRVRVRKALKRDTSPSVPPKTSPGAQNMKMEPDALGTAKNEFGSENHENGT
jgi:hypothetical protein